MTVSGDHLITTHDGTKINVRQLPGSGRTVAFLHGFTGDGSTMSDLADASRAGRPALLVDLVGHGKSDAPAHPLAYEMHSVVDQVLSAIGVHPPGHLHLVGYSMGGRVALSMAARAPGYFGSVTSISATAGIDDPKERATRHERDIALADHISEIGVETFVDEWLAHPLFAPLLENLDPRKLEATKQQRRQNTVAGLTGSLRGTGTGAMPPLWDKIGSLHQPLLAIAGALDEPYVRIAQRLAERAADGRCAIVDGCGHALPLENPGAVATLLTQFLEGCESREPPETRTSPA